MSTVVKDLGAVSAYAYAAEKGYTGTEAEFAELMADYAEVGQRAEDAADRAEAALDEFTSVTADATTLPEGSSATAEYSDGHLTLGIPKGDKGDGAYHVELSGESFVIHTDASGVAAAQEFMIYIDARQGTTKKVISRVEGLPSISTGSGTIAPEIIKHAFTGSVATIIYTIPANTQISAGQINAQFMAYINDGTSNGFGVRCSLSVAVVKDGAKGDKGDKGDTGEVSQAEFDEVAGDVSQLKSEITAKANVSELLKAFPTDTASGAIASFSDGAELPLKSLVVDIDPVQDLHGQDAPYPAGGGKNLFNPSPYADYLQSNGKYRTKAAYTAQKRTQIPASLLNTVCVFSVYMDLTNSGTLSNALVQVVIGGTVKKGNLIENGSTGRSEVSFTPTSTDDYVSITYGSNGDNEYTYYDMQLEAGSTATAYAPYSNICPISGHTQAVVTRTGVNVWDEEWEQGSLDNNGQPVAYAGNTRSKNYISIVPNASYYGVPAGNIVWYWYDADQAFISMDVSTSAAVTAPSTARYLKFRTTDAYGGTYNHDISINYPSTDTDYHPYSGQSITIALGQTVYGGKLDVLSGELVIDRAGVDLGSKTFTKWVNDNNTFACAVPGISTTSQNITCNTYAPLINGGATWAAILSYDMTIYKPLNDIYLLIRDTRYTDATAFNTSISGVQLVYPLATPITVTLTPNELSTLLGANNIWSDAGEVTAEYRADPTLFIQRKIAEALS